ncbi:MAG: ribose-phosphate pyrophosphokinase [Elusimicrobiota bacterium]|nr:ribose-phosphate pyrophosphokinase [Elusimicrobiota bacterium]
MPNTSWRDRTPKIISGTANPALAEKISGILKIPLCKTKIGRFSDGEIDTHILENVRGDDCYIIQPTCAPSNQNIMELLIIMDALRRASAGRITAVVPYFGYARADRKSAPRVAITAKLVANLITSAGANRVMTIDLHAAQIQGFFDIPVDNLYARPVVLDYIKDRDFKDYLVVSPDIGSVKRARSFAKRLNADLAIIDKRRPKPNEASVYNIIGSVEGKNCFIFDDMVDTGGTLAMVAHAIKARGAKKIVSFCTHGVLSGHAFDKIEESPIEELIVTDTIPVDASKSSKIKSISVASLLAEAIGRNHKGNSISELFI